MSKSLLLMILHVDGVPWPTVYPSSLAYGRLSTGASMSLCR